MANSATYQQEISTGKRININITPPTNFTNNGGFIAQTHYDIDDINQDNFSSRFAKLINCIEIDWGNINCNNRIKQIPNLEGPAQIKTSIDLLHYIFALESRITALENRVTSLEENESHETQTYEVTLNVDHGTSTTPNTQTVNSGDSVSWTIDPEQGYKMPTSVNIDGVTIDGNTITVSNITSNKTINITCEVIQYEVTCNVSNGSKTPNSKQTVNYGGSVYWDITPDEGYQMPQSVSGANISNNRVTVSNVTSNKTITINCISNDTPQTTYYWYVGTASTKPSSLPTNDSQLATGTNEGWRKFTQTSGTVYNANTTHIRFNKGAYYWLIIPTGMKVETSDGNNYLLGFESSGEYGPDTTTIPNYTIYASRDIGGDFSGILKY